MKVITQDIGDGIELMIEGIPQSIMTPSQQAKTALSLVQLSLPLGVDLTPGIIGGMLEATLRIENEYYKFKYCIRARRIITALEVYSQAIQWIEFQRLHNRVDPQLADDAINYLRRDCRKQFNK